MALSDDIRMWTSGPYIALDASHFLYVTKSGDFVYQRREALRLNKPMTAIPASIGMKHDKIQVYLNEEKVDAVKHIQSRWKALRLRLVQDTGRIATSPPNIDDLGITDKSWLLKCDLLAESTVERQIFAVLRDYVQWRGEGSEDREDSLDLDVNIPTLNLKVGVILDFELYAHTHAQKPKFPGIKAIKLSQQTVEGQGFDPLDFDVKQDMDEVAGSMPERLVSKRSHVAIDYIRQEYTRLCNEIRQDRLSDPMAVDENAVPSLPQKYFYYYLKFSRMNPGTRLSIRWSRPERARR